MYLFHSLFKTQLHRFLFRAASARCLPLLLIITVFIACTNSEDFANPLDSENLRTAGSPKGLTLYPGDQQVRVTWIESGQEGIKAYKIYRRSIANSEEPFELVGTVDAPASEFVDTQNVENDRRDAQGQPIAYEYRISYIDINDVETPDPTNPPSVTEEPMRIWQTAAVIPSIPPPIPVVTLGVPSDLTVKLFWENYDFPDDFSLFRVYVAREDSTAKQLAFRPIAEITRDQLYYFDVNFKTDGESKVYRVAAVDEFGIEAITTINAASPNLPPAPPKNIIVTYARRLSYVLNTKYDAIISWNANTERDLAGYQIYTKDAEGNLLLRQTAGPKDTSLIILGEDPIVIDQLPYGRPYFITAFDDTPKLDGKRDESEMVAAERLNFIFGEHELELDFTFGEEE
ncbi:MAG: hypothetical protein OXI43_22060 [Candidatus Poribacteria bacterium]|nr:hypothetical protein [Candidatus Poribacteria bacterium]